MAATSSQTPSRFASRVFLVASIYGALALLPMYALEFKGPLARPEFLYGFVGVALAWQAAFFVISRDVQRYRPLMPVAILEKLTFGIPAIVLFSQERLGKDMLAGGLIDLLLAALFLVAWKRTPRQFVK